jgi:uncharacterized protein
MKERILLAAFGIAALALSACGGKTDSSTKEAADDQIYTASFDCAKAGNDIERRICSNEQLSSLDRSLADLYKKALIKQPDLASSQRAWINERNECTDNDCLVKSYWERYSLLENAAAEQAAESQVSAESAAQEAAEQAATNDDPYPYTAVLSCGNSGFNNLNLIACMTGDVETEIELDNGGDYGLYKGYNLPSDWQQTERGIEIPLKKSFRLEMQNSSEHLIMGLRVFDNNGNILFQKQVAQFGVIRVDN